MDINHPPFTTPTFYTDTNINPPPPKTCHPPLYIYTYTHTKQKNGVDHIHFAMDFAYGSNDMTLAFDTLRPYIDEGKVNKQRKARSLSFTYLHFRYVCVRVCLPPSAPTGEGTVTYIFFYILYIYTYVRPSIVESYIQYISIHPPKNRCHSCPRRPCTGRGGSGRTIPR